MSVKRFLMFLIVAGLLALGLAVPYVLGGGGPGPGGAGPGSCYAYYVNWEDPNFGSVTTLDTGQSLTFHVRANCPVTISNTWNSESAVVTQYDINNGLYGESDVSVTFTTQPDQMASADHYVNAVFEGYPDDVYQYIRVVIGSPEYLEVSLSLHVSPARWASYVDYTSRYLTVDQRITNVGVNDAYHVLVTGATATNGVMLLTDCSFGSNVDCYPKHLADLMPLGAGADFSMRFIVPEGVSLFRSTPTATALDYNWEEHYYPSDSPAPAP